MRRRPRRRARSARQPCPRPTPHAQGCFRAHRPGAPERTRTGRRPAGQFGLLSPRRENYRGDRRPADRSFLVDEPSADAAASWPPALIGNDRTTGIREQHVCGDASRYLPPAGRANLTPVRRTGSDGLHALLEAQRELDVEPHVGLGEIRAPQLPDAARHEPGAGPGRRTAADPRRCAPPGRPRRSPPDRRGKVGEVPGRVADADGDRRIGSVRPHMLDDLSRRQVGNLGTEHGDHVVAEDADEHTFRRAELLAGRATGGCLCPPARSSPGPEPRQEHGGRADGVLVGKPRPRPRPSVPRRGRAGRRAAARVRRGRGPRRRCARPGGAAPDRSAPPAAAAHVPAGRSAGAVARRWRPPARPALPASRRARPGPRRARRRAPSGTRASAARPPAASSATFPAFPTACMKEPSRATALSDAIHGRDPHRDHAPRPRRPRPHERTARPREPRRRSDRRSPPSSRSPRTSRHACCSPPSGSPPSGSPSAPPAGCSTSSASTPPASSAPLVEGARIARERLKA